MRRTPGAPGCHAPAELAVVLSCTALLTACAKGDQTLPGPADSPDADAVPAPDSAGDAETPEATPDGETNPCEGVTCVDPPPNTCANSQQLVVYDPVGSCDNGSCHYASHQETCPQGCDQGACIGDPCVGVSCNSPPAAYCADDAHLVVYDVPGTCDGGTCVYVTHTEYCSYGCANSVCNGNPCAGVSCSTAPANYCTDEDHLEVFSAPGACQNGTCEYPHHNEFCTHGCSQGVCEGDPCQGVSCTTPPANSCAASDTLLKYSSPGTCSNGSCQYASSTVFCQYGCANGVCKECQTQADCAGGAWCNAGVCELCNTNQHCGTNCTDCTSLSPAKICDASGSTCIECNVDSDCGSGKWCSNHGCVACDTATHCGPTCMACGGATPDCNGSTCVCLSGHCGTPCPTALSLATWDAGDDGWTWDGLWERHAGGYMTAGSTTSYSSPYTQNLTSGTPVDLSGCSSAVLGFQVRLDDDPDYDGSVDKSERLYVQCSGDGGGVWTNLTPNPWPPNQSACATSYCSGGKNASRAFPWTSQSITLPASCLTANARFRFQAKGQNVWRLLDPGWYVDSVTID